MVSEEYQLGLVVRNTPMTSFQDRIDAQKELLCLQIDQLQNVVLAQCELTGANPLSEEMAAGSMSIRIGKRPRDLLNSKAVKYMLSVFSIKDAISKKESRDIGGLLGLTATQVREFFTNQRSRVRKFAGLSREKAIRVDKVKEQQNGVLGSSEPQMPINPVPLDTIAPLASEGPSCSTQPEAIGSNDLEKSFVEKIFMLMRIEETFSGQVKLLEWILQIENTMILLWFLNKGGVMILATWLSQAAIEEQTSVLHVILQVLCHLPVNKALPVHMSAILQSVNRLRFYRASAISNRARVLLARWSKVFARSRSLKKVNGSKSVADVESEVLLKKSIEEVMDDESWEAQAIKEDALVPLSENSELRKLEPLKLLTSSTDDSNKKLCLGISSYQTKERRKVLLVEHPGQKLAGRNIQTARSTQTNQSRPLSADDIQKAKMRAHFLRNKYGKSVVAPNDGPQAKAEEATKCSSILADTSASESIPLIPLRTDEQKQHLPVMLPAKSPTQEVQNEDKLSLDPVEPKLKKRKRMQIPWLTPAEVRMNTAWRYGSGQDSKEVDIQTNRNRRERETIYSASHEIPPNPKEPWDIEMDYDDSLTPEIPSTQLPDNDVVIVEEETAVTETVTMIDSSRPSPDLNEMVSALASAFALTSNNNSSSTNSRSSAAEPDYDLLEVLLQTPDLVFALTSGQSEISNEETVRVLDMIKARRAAASPTAPAPVPISLGRSGNSILPVSLPSPTPSSEPVTNQWGGEDSRNPFSSNLYQSSSNIGHHQNQSAPFIPQQFDHHLNMNNNIANTHNYGNIIIDEPSQQYHQKPTMPTWQVQQTQNSWVPDRRYEHIQNRDNVHAGYGGGWERDDFNGRLDYDNNNTNNNNSNRRRIGQADAEYNHNRSYSSHDRRHLRPESEQGLPLSRNWASSSPDQQRDQYNNNNNNTNINRYGDRRWHDGRR